MNLSSESGVPWCNFFFAVLGGLIAFPQTGIQFQIRTSVMFYLTPVRDNNAHALLSYNSIKTKKGKVLMETVPGRNYVSLSFFFGRAITLPHCWSERKSEHIE